MRHKGEPIERAAVLVARDVLERHRGPTPRSDRRSGGRLRDRDRRRRHDLFAPFCPTRSAQRFTERPDQQRCVLRFKRSDKTDLNASFTPASATCTFVKCPVLCIAPFHSRRRTRLGAGDARARGMQQDA